jgi:hypothetical protein
LKYLLGTSGKIIETLLSLDRSRRSLVLVRRKYNISSHKLLNLYKGNRIGSRTLGGREREE